MLISWTGYLKSQVHLNLLINSSFKFGHNSRTDGDRDVNDISRHFLLISENIHGGGGAI